MPRVIPLKLAGKGNFVHKRSLFVLMLWLPIEALIINNRLNVLSSLRVSLLRLFGAKIGKNCRFLHALKVKFPWNLEVGDNCWFGEDVWIYNQGLIKIGSDVCISQGTMLIASSHNVGTDMALCVTPTVIEDGVWITSKCVVQMGVTIHRSAVVTPNSVVHTSLDAGNIYGGNPCVFIRRRFD